jgi:hypothetical protein
MGWRYVSYIEGENTLTLPIQPMLTGHCLVYVPDASRWKKEAPSWARNKRRGILKFLSAVNWNRGIKFVDGGEFITEEPVSGSLESTPAGQKLEAMNLFDPGSEFSRRGAMEVWLAAARRFAEAQEGEFHIYRTEAVPGSVFEEIELPALESNPNLKLVFHSEALPRSQP